MHENPRLFTKMIYEFVETKIKSKGNLKLALKTMFLK